MVLIRFLQYANVKNSFNVFAIDSTTFYTKNCNMCKSHSMLNPSTNDLTIFCLMH